MNNENIQSNSMNYLYLIVFFVILVVIGAFFVNKIPSTQDETDQFSQRLEDSDTINAKDSGNTLGTKTSPVPKASGSLKTMEDKLKIEDQVVGTGVEATPGKKITVNYTGTLTDGTKFDSSLNPGRTPFSFVLGAGEVIQGWDQGFAGMKVGGKRKLTIPPSLGYGSQDMGSIPSNSTLIFEVELLNVE